MIVNTICLCGSIRFLDDYREANVQLTLRGFAVITISMAMPKNTESPDAVCRRIADEPPAVWAAGEWTNEKVWLEAAMRCHATILA
jgi:hypothetical protein